MNSPFKANPNPSSKIDRNKVYIAASISILLFIAYSIYRSFSAIEQENTPKIQPIWSAFAESEQAALYIDMVNINFENQDPNKVDYWEKLVMLDGFEVTEDINDGMLIGFDSPIDNIVTHYLVDCSRDTYQRLNSIYTQVDGKTRFMNTNNAPLPPKPLNDDIMNDYSARYACQLKDIEVTQRLDLVE